MPCVSLHQNSKNQQSVVIAGFFFIYQCFADLSEIFAVRKTSRIYDSFRHNASVFC